MDVPNIFVLDTSFNIVGFIDEALSFIWTDRYNEYGDFELQLAESKFNPNVYKKDYYITHTASEHMMIIEEIKFTNSIENGSYYIIKGRSLESILERRVIAEPYKCEFDIVNDILAIVHNSIGTLSSDSRKIDIIYGVDQENMNRRSYEYKEEIEFLGEDLYSAIKSLCSHTDPITEWPSKWPGYWPDESDDPAKFNVGFKLIPIFSPVGTDLYEFRFTLYEGVDRTYDQDSVPPVIFSRTFDNLGDFDIEDSITEYKNTAMLRGNYQKQIVKGSGENKTYEYEDHYIYRSCGIPLTADQKKHNIGRREIFVDTDVSRRKKDEEGNETDELYTAEEFVNMMKQQGFKALYEYQASSSSSCEFYPYGQYEYGRDFKMGDIVHVDLDDSGLMRARVNEVICSWDGDGFRVFPSFQLM